MAPLFRLLGIPALALCSAMATTATADLSASDLDVINTKSFWDVQSSDGARLGVSQLVSVKDDRMRILVRPSPGSPIRERGINVMVYTTTDQVSFTNGALVLDQSGAVVRQKVQRFGRVDNAEAYFR